MKWLFRRLFPASGGPLCSLQSEAIIQTKRRHFIVFVWRNSNELLEPLWQPWSGVSPTAILNEEKTLGTRVNIWHSHEPINKWINIEKCLSFVMIVRSVGNTLFCRCFILFHFWCINIFHRFCILDINKNAAKQYVERSEPNRVSGSHDVDFTHENKTVHYFHCMEIEGYLPGYSIRCLCLRLDMVRGEPFDFWGEGGLEDFPLERFFFPTDQQGRYFFQCKSGAWYIFCDYPLQKFFFTPVRSGTGLTCEFSK